MDFHTRFMVLLNVFFRHILMTIALLKGEKCKSIMDRANS